MKEDNGSCEGAWVSFIRRHWQMSLALMLITLGAAALSVFVLLWVVAETQVLGIVPGILGEWTVNYVIIFILTAIFWELVAIASWGIPLVLVVYFLWYRKLPEKERVECEGRKKRKKSIDDSGFSLVVSFLWLVFVWAGGKWDLAFRDWTFNDWVYTWLAACLSVLAVAGILGGVYVLWLMFGKPEARKGTKKENGSGPGK